LREGIGLHKGKLISFLPPHFSFLIVLLLDLFLLTGLDVKSIHFDPLVAHSQKQLLVPGGHGVNRLLPHFEGANTLVGLGAPQIDISINSSSE
jgi:hypothetical protein